MKIKPTGSTFQGIKDTLKQKLSKSGTEAREKLKEAKDYVSPKAQKTVKEAAGWVDEKINDPRLKEAAQKASNWVDDRINDVKDNIAPKVKESAKKAADWVDDRINDVKENVAPKVKESAKKAADWVDDRINDVKENVAPKVKESAKKTADWANEKLDDAKDSYETLKQKYEQYTMKKPKVEILANRIVELQKQYLFNTTFLNRLKQRNPYPADLIAKLEKEQQQLEKEIKIANEKYNHFKTLQDNAQKAFDRLNGFNK